jgi:3-dehydroquinate dehydratase II
MAKESILVLNGANLNMLGVRESDIYGKSTLTDIERACVAAGEALDLLVDCRQSNHEGELVSIIQEARASYDGLILNAGAYTHTSIAIHDALRCLDIPILEVHLSNPHARESFRHTSFVTPVARGLITGLGGFGYILAVQAMAAILRNETDVAQLLEG